MVMDVSYSSHVHSGEIGGTFHLSPSHPHHVDALSTIRRNLRRSLSRSPSRHQGFNRSVAASPVSPRSPTQIGLTSPLSRGMFTPTSSQECRMGVMDDHPATGSKRTRMALRRTPLRLSERLQNSVKQASRRGLTESSGNGNGNVSPPSSQSSAEGQENRDRVNEDRVIITEPMEFKDIGTGKKQRDIANLRGSFAKSSPLKRSDGFMNLDTVTMGSPSAKRRSLHGGPLNSCLDPDRSSTDESNEDGNETDEDPPMDFRSSLAPRMASRRSHLPLRVSDRSTASRARKSFEMEGPSARSNARSKPRMSLDSAMPLSHTPKDSGRHMANDIPRPQFARPFAHPLSKTLNPNSPTIPNAQDVAPDISIFQSPARSPLSFSKSLPIGALRPQMKAHIQHGPHNESLFATPNLYKIARPNPAAFMSTGLISKRHRNPEDLPPPPGAPRDMPDTPCKRFQGGFAMPSSPSSVKSISKPRFAQPEFGTPSRPFNLAGKGGMGSLGSSSNIFGTSIRQGGADRRISFGSIDGEEFSQSPNAQAESQSSNDELPPTPTKKASDTPSQKQNSLRSTLLGRRPTLSASTFVPPDDAEQKLTLQVPTLFTTPAVPSIFIPPRTPADATFPDPSVLSISPQTGSPGCSPIDSPLFNGKISTRPSDFPETPSHRDSTNTFSASFAQSITPSHHAPPKEIDPLLLTRFKKVEWYGGGEFSDVYKVTQTCGTVLQPSYTSPAPSFTSAIDKVWIVKKLKAPYTSLKVREKRLQEVEIMRALGKHDNVVHLSDSWEANNRLYIQTEFCEEGNLHSFLAKTGHRGRLDDFRIWKILIELCQGLKHIHDSDFIHLDLKPANVFIDFEGVLKIGDFGMASRWPAPPHVEGEGDRRYMGPDLLQGRFDKPADIFAMGMIMFEIAGNCIPPDNGVSWQKLRSGDWEGLPSLTSGSSNSFPVDSQDSLTFSGDNLDNNGPYDAQDEMELFDRDMDSLPWSQTVTPSIQKTPPEDGVQPPSFMLDPAHEQALDRVVRWMMLPEPSERPTVDQILQVGGVVWVNARRRSGATVYEGQWGPSNHVLNHVPAATKPEDEEMLDVL